MRTWSYAAFGYVAYEYYARQFGNRKLVQRTRVLFHQHRGLVFGARLGKPMRSDWTELIRRVASQDQRITDLGRPGQQFGLHLDFENALLGLQR